MKVGRLVLGIVAVLALVLCGVGAVAASAAQPTEDVKSLAKGNNAFAFDLYSVISSGKDNLFLSPYSISSALAMTYAGAGGNTAAEMASAMHYYLEPDRLHRSFAALNSAFNAGGKSYRLAVANALWSQIGLNFRPDYAAITQKYYGAGVRTVDFVEANEEARLAINRWVEENTQNKIVELLKPGVLNALTRLVLTNAIYFKGQWKYEFKKDRTENAAFHLSATKTADVPFMNQVAEFGYAETKDAQVVELPYAGGELAMDILLPRAGSDIAQLEAALGAGGLDPFVSGLYPQKVELSIPRFKFEAELSLGGALQKLGMIDAFSDQRADFSGISDTFLYITAVIHKAFVEVNEEGTEAAAATAVVMGTKSAPVYQPVQFVADRPFFFVIRDLATGSILFMGRVTDPRR